MNQNAALGLMARIAGAILNPLITLIFAAAVIMFLWGVVEYIRGASDPAARTDGQQHIFWGLVGILIMISAFVIVDLIGQTIGVGSPTAQVR